MNTGNLITIQYATHHRLTNDENSYIPVHLLKNTGQTVGKVKPQHKDSTPLEEISLMNYTYFGAIYREIHLDMKLDYTIRRIFQEMSLSELETLHHLYELERTQILQSLALAVLKISFIDQFLLTTKETYYGILLVPKKFSPLYVFEDKRCYKRIP